MKGGAQKDMAKVQTCVLRVSIHCEGCKHKVKKLLQKVKGVENVSIDSEQGKVTVFGDVDPQILVSKLEKSGKNAELWGPHGKAPPPFNFKAQKNGKDSLLIKPGIQAQHLNAEKGRPKNLNFFGQKDDKKSVKFKLPEEDFDEDEGSDFGSDEEDDFGSESSDYGAASPPHPKKPTKSASAHFDDSSKKGITKKKGGNGSIDKLIKAMLGKSVGKGDSDKKGKDKDKKKKNSDAKMGKEKKGPSAIEIDAMKGGKIKIPTSSDIAKIKKKGSNFDGFGQPGNSQGMMMPSYGNKGGPPPAPNHHQFQGFEMGGNNNNPQYAQQQHQMMMMMMNQQRMNQNNGYGGYPPHHPMMMGGYGGPPPQQMMAPADDRYTHMFNDENTGSCSVM